MDNMLFYKSFSFLKLSFKSSVHNDASSGIKCHYIGRMLNGTGHIVTESHRDFHLEKGDIFYFPIGLRYHSYWFPSTSVKQTLEWESYGFTFFPCLEGKQYSLQKLYPDEKAIALLDQLAADKTVTVSTVGLLYSFLGSVLPQMQEDTYDPRQTLLTKAKNYISMNPEFSVPALARHCGMSESGLYAFFRAYAHMTPVEMKNQIRVETAIKLLGSTDLSIEEISTRVGFKSVAHFRKIVNAHTGKTPTQIRKESVGTIFIT